eukprot:1391398-Ditylum_brightwellii.AAC.1
MLGNGKRGIILGGAIRWGKKLFPILGCGIFAVDTGVIKEVTHIVSTGACIGERCVATWMLVRREGGGAGGSVTTLGGGAGIFTLGCGACITTLG